MSLSILYSLSCVVYSLFSILCRLSSSFYVCCSEVTVTSLHPPRLCRLAVFSIKPTLLSLYKVAGEHQLVVLFTIASDGCTMGVTEGKLSMSELVGIRERESVRLLLKKQTEQHAQGSPSHSEGHAECPIVTERLCHPANSVSKGWPG